MRAAVGLLGACALLCALAPSRADAAAPAPRSNGLTGTGGTAATASIAKPAAAVAGDLLIASVNASGTGAITAPAGWTLIADSAGGSRLDTFYRVMQAGDTGPWSASLGSSRSYTVNVVAYTSPDAGTPVDVFQTATGTSGALTAPAATSTLPNEAVLYAYGFTMSISGTVNAAPAGSTMVSTSPSSAVPSAILSLNAAATSPGAVTRISESASGTLSSQTNAIAHTIVLRENPTLTAAFPAASYAWGSWPIGTATSAEQSLSVTSDRPWGVQIAADRSDGRMTEYSGTTYLSRTLATPLQWGLTRLNGVAQAPTWTDVSGTPTAAVSGQAANTSAADVGVTFRQQVSYADDAGLGGHQYRIVITYNAGQGF